MEYLKLSIEFLVIFIILYIIYYLFFIRKCKKNRDYVPTEVNLILIIHKIDAKKINLYEMVKVVSFVTVLVLSLVITIVSESFNSSVLSILIGSVFTIIIALISYRIIGNHYKRISETNKKENKSKKST